LCAEGQDLLEPKWLFVQVKETTVNPVFGSNSIPTEGFTSVNNSRDLTSKDRIYKNPMCCCARIKSSQCATVILL
jgi:hypothetical protein